MDSVFQFLSGGSSLAVIIGAIIVLGLVAVVVIVVVGFFQGREISLWPPKIGARPGSSKNADNSPAQAASQVITWTTNSRSVDERDHWLAASVLVVGVQYSPKFFKDFFDIVQQRCEGGRTTVALVLDPDGEAARYLAATKTGSASVVDGVAEIERILAEADEGRGYTRLKKHDRVMRYSFIRTEQCIWVKFFTNAPYRAIVPAVRIPRGSEHWEFFERDIRALEEVST